MIPELLRPVLAPIAHAVDPEGEVDALIPTGNPAHGDYQWNFAFRVAKARRQNPRALAEQIAGELRSVAHPGIRKVEVAGPGFINLFLDDAWLASAVASQVRSPAMGIAQEGAGRTVIIDFSSPNVAKRMHIGHMRSTHIGHALVRMHRAAGWTVIGDNHIGDWGTPFGKLLVAWRKWRDDAAFAADGIGELERLYVLFGKKAEEEPALMDEARAETAKLQRGEPENTALWRMFLDVSMAEFNAVYARMGVTFDETLGESAYRDRTEPLLARLEREGVAEASEGALIARLGQDTMVLRKKDGAVTYGATDLACVEYRVERWNPDRIVYVTDMRQQGHFKQVFDAARKMGVNADLVHAWFGMLVLPEGAMSTRQGNVIRLVDLMDEGVRRARVIVDDKSPGLPDAQRADIADTVGVGAIRYADLSQHPQTNVTFDWDRMLSMDGNTATFLLYSHARCASILAKADEEPDLDRLAASHPLERELVLALGRYPEAVAASLRSYRPNLIAEALFDTAQRFNRFYFELRVLDGGDARPHRLALVDASRRVLRHGLELLGLRVLDRM